jgi:acetylornithine deacetylase/succinyl-diaminopimelate desuccinylase-like protein
MKRLRLTFLLAFVCVATHAQTQSPANNNAELLRHFQALVQIDTTNPPGNESKAVDYIQKVLEAEGIPVTVVAQEPGRANLIARLKGNGSKRPILLMGHTDTVRIDASKWTFPPFSAARDSGYIYGRGTIDNKWQVAAGMMTLLMLKRGSVPLDRDVIFLAEAGEEASTGPGIEFVVNQHWAEIDAEACIAEAGTVRRENGKERYAFVQTGEKIPKGAILTSTGPSGHGSRPMRSNAIVHLSGAIERIAQWDPPMRLNDTTRSYFEKLATLGTPQEAARYNGLLNPAKSAAVREYLAENDPNAYSMLHTSVSPNIIQGGFQVNVIPSEAQVTLDIRALPDEDMTQFYEQLRKVINDPAIKIEPNARNERPGAAPSSLGNEVYRAIEAANRKVFNIPTIPQMSTGATDMAFLRAKGMQCYGTGLAADAEDLAKGFGAHSDQERILEDSLYKYLAFQWDVLNSVAITRK